MEPVRVNLYGLLAITRRRYVQQLIAAIVFAAVGLAAWWWFWCPNRPRFLDQLETGAAGRDRFVAVMDALPWIILIVVALQFVEAYFVFRLFRRREAMQRAAPPTPPTSGA